MNFLAQTSPTEVSAITVIIMALIALVVYLNKFQKRWIEVCHTLGISSKTLPSDVYRQIFNLVKFAASKSEDYKQFVQSLSINTPPVVDDTEAKKLQMSAPIITDENGVIILRKTFSLTDNENTKKQAITFNYTATKDFTVQIDSVTVGQFFVLYVTQDENGGHSMSLNQNIGLHATPGSKEINKQPGSVTRIEFYVDRPGFAMASIEHKLV